jgi:hypothetical protein
MNVQRPEIKAADLELDEKKLRRKAAMEAVCPKQMVGMLHLQNWRQIYPMPAGETVSIGRMQGRETEVTGFRA